MKNTKQMQVCIEELVSTFKTFKTSSWKGLESGKDKFKIFFNGVAREVVYLGEDNEANEICIWYGTLDDNGSFIDAYPMCYNSEDRMVKIKELNSLD